VLRFEGLEIVQTGFRLRADLEVARGARVGVIGPSGAGKSTLLGAISGFVPVQSGQMMWEGASLLALSPSARPVSILFQDKTCFRI